MTTRHGSDSGIDRRDFARITFGALGAAVGSRTLRAQQANVPGVKLCVQSPANPSDDQFSFSSNSGPDM